MPRGAVSTAAAQAAAPGDGGTAVFSLSENLTLRADAFEQTQRAQ
jgi:hypothetical protein